MQENMVELLHQIFSFINIFAIVSVLLGVWVFLLFMRWCIDALVAFYPKYRIQLSQTYPMLRIIVWLATTIYIVVGIIKPPEAILFASLGSMGLAVGLAAQDAIRNVLAGIIMAFSPRFRVGDMVQIGEHYGEVIGLDLSITRLQTFDDSTVSVPNANVLSMPVSNANGGELNEMVVIPIALPPNISIKKVKTAAITAAKCSPYVYLKKPITATISPEYDKGFYIKLVVKAYVIDVRMEKAMATDIAERIMETLFDKDLLKESAYDPDKPETISHPPEHSGKED